MQGAIRLLQGPHRLLARARQLQSADALPPSPLSLYIYEVLQIMSLRVVKEVVKAHMRYCHLHGPVVYQCSGQTCSRRTAP